MMKSLFRFIIFTTALFFAASSTVAVIHALRIGVFTVEESGHLLPMTAIVHEAVKQGHTVDIFLPVHGIKNTRSLFPSPATDGEQQGGRGKGGAINFFPVIGAEQLVGDHEDNFTLYQQVTESDTFTSLAIVNEKAHFFFKDMVPGLRKTIENAYCTQDADAESPIVDVILTDYALNNLMLALHRTIPCIRKKPLVYLWPLTLSFPTTSRSYIPALSTGYTVAELAANPLSRLKNYLLQRFLILAQRIDAISKVKELMIASEVSSQKSSSSSLEEITKKVDQSLAEEVKNGDFDAVNEILVNHFVITPSIFGLDLAQPLCPNIRPVGFLNPPPAKDSFVHTNNKNENDEDEDIPSAWKDWLENDCLSSNSKGAIYVNMGSVAILPVEWLQGLERILRHLTEKEGLCVIWKIRLREQRRMLQPPSHLSSLGSIKKEIASGALDVPSSQLNQHQESESEKEAKKFLTQPKRGNRLAVVARIPFAPKLLLSAKRGKNNNNNNENNGGQKNYIAAFVSHCGDTSVYESLEALVPIVGIPLFADQPDMCARILDAEVGTSIDKRSLSLTSPQENKNANLTEAIVTSPLFVAIRKVVDDRSADEEERRTSMVFKMSYLKRVGESMGGAAEAVRVLELSAMHRGETIKHFTCSTLTTKLPWYLRDNWDISIELGILVFVLFWWIPRSIWRFLVWMCCGGKNNNINNNDKKKEKEIDGNSKDKSKKKTE